jgi:hypothetical protein
LVQALRLVHPNDRISENERIDLLTLPINPQLKVVESGVMHLVTPWRGLVRLYPGSAVGWGGDTYTNHMTISYNRVPQKFCLPLIEAVESPAMRSLGLVAIYVSATAGQGELYCLQSDAYCQRPLKILPMDQVKESCNKNTQLTIMFTYSAQ